MKNREKLADHIVFVGFMGAGKSSVACCLACSEKMSSIDVDTFIERESGMSIAQIFACEGEEGFRRREQEVLRSMLEQERCILACGGGIVTQEAGRKLLTQLGTVVYLKVEADEAVARISHPETRPLLSGKIAPEELLAARLPYYEEVADLVVDTGGLTVEQVVEKVQRALRSAGKLQDR